MVALGGAYFGGGGGPCADFGQFLPPWTGRDGNRTIVVPAVKHPEDTSFMSHQLREEIQLWIYLLDVQILHQVPSEGAHSVLIRCVTSL